MSSCFTQLRKAQKALFWAMEEVRYTYEHHKVHYERDDTVKIFLNAYDVEKERQFIKRIDRYIPKNQVRLLDIGCGVGLHASLWAEREKNVTASDFSTKFRDYVTEHYNFPFIWTDVLNCSIKDQYDVCFCMAIATIQVDEQARFQTFKTLADLVRVGSFLVLVSPSNQRAFDIRSRRASLHALDKRDFEKLEELGLHVERVFHWSSSPRSMWRSPASRWFANLIEKVGASLGIGARKVVICRRKELAQ